MPALPPAIAPPPPPFPAIVAQHSRLEAVAPGVVRAEYDLRTVAGPLVIHVVAVNLANPTVHLRTALADDSIVSPGEPVTAMARGAGAVAAINGDFFAIDRSNAPLNVLVQDGVVLRSPGYGRPALGVTADGRAVIGTPTLVGSIASPELGQQPLAAVDVWPVDGYSLLLPIYGAPPPPNAVPLPDGSNIAYPPSLPAPLPQPSDPADASDVAVSAQVTIDGAVVRQAVGGGPLLLKDGLPYDDPTAPKNGTDKARFPVSGVGLVGDSTLLMVEVDGHQPGYSVGLKRAEFAALFQGLGADEAMGLDSGGSSTIAARPLGDGRAELLNRPSDGRERPVADALLVLSSAPSGPAAQLVVRPERIRALPGVRVPVRVAAVDAGDHPAPLPSPAQIVAVPAALGTVADEAFASSPSARGTGNLIVAAGELQAAVPVEIVPRLARLRIETATLNPAPGARILLSAVGFDGRGRRVDVDGAVRWQLAGTGNLSPDGTYDAPLASGDATITAIAGGAHGVLALGTGSHAVPLPWKASWFSFVTYPSGGGGGVDRDDGCGCLALDYDFTQRARGAYARTAIVLGGRPVAFSVDVDGDGRGAWLRLRVADAQGRLYAVTLARRVGWTGWRRVEARLPADAPLPLTLEDLYVVRPAQAIAGTLRFRAPKVAFAGASTPQPVAARRLSAP
ncbi:MAG TPA: phosphodiester glycosidase family protein [Candidatus Dormibacteraeota bacterium]|nr:phosphodiester glycosidase family protein [Candidatus Dormibacteraeota bacterium]